MSNAVGKQQGGGFLPSSPSPEDLLKSLGVDTGGWSALNSNGEGAPAERSPAAQEADDLRKCFAQVYATAAGRKVVEALLDKTLRCSPYLNNDPEGGRVYTLEQQTAYGLERKGQNGIATWFMSMIYQGQNIKAPAKKKARKKTG